MALALVCLERSIEAAGLTRERFATLLASLWEFCDADDLGQWDEMVRNIAEPDWSALPSSIKDMFNDVDEIGTGNLYGATVDQFTLLPTRRVIAAAQRLGVTLPDLHAFGISTWTEVHGWGDPIPDARSRLLDA